MLARGMPLSVSRGCRGRAHGHCADPRQVIDRRNERHTNSIKKGLNMNSAIPNPYPTGRWTQPAPTRAAEPARIAKPVEREIVAPRKRTRRSPKLAPGLRDLPLKQLFLSDP